MTAIMAASPEHVERNATIIQFPRRPWWTSAENPACVDWCECEHDQDEFAAGAILDCRRTIVDDDRFQVCAQSCIQPHEDGTPEKLGTRDSGVLVTLDLRELEPADMADLTVAYGLALEMCGR